MLFAFFVSTVAGFESDIFLEMCIIFSTWTHFTFPYGTRDGFSPHRFVGVSDWSGLAHVGGLFRRTSPLVSYHGDGHWIHSFFSLVLRLVYRNIHLLYVCPLGIFCRLDLLWPCVFVQGIIKNAVTNILDALAKRWWPFPYLCIY